MTRIKSSRARTCTLVALALLTAVVGACGRAPVAVGPATLDVPTAMATRVSATASTTPGEAAVRAETPQEVVHAEPTSRGPGLQATDPGSVVLGSDRLQLIEFFRFT
jgi:hypothetical protein